MATRKISSKQLAQSGAISDDVLKWDGSTWIPAAPSGGAETYASLTSKLAAGSGGGTTNFLRADGTFAAPPAGGAGGSEFLVTAVSTGSSQDITLPRTLDPEDVVVTVDGLLQDPANYSITGTTLSLTAPDVGQSITARALKGFTTTTVFNSTTDGLVPAPTTSTGKYLRDDGVWGSVLTPSAPNNVTGITYTLALQDSSGYVRFTNASGCTITVPDNTTAAFAIGAVVTLRAATTGTVALAAAGGVTLNKQGGASGTLTFAEEGAVVQLKKVDTNEWDIIGNTA